MRPRALTAGSQIDTVRALRRIHWMTSQHSELAHMIKAHGALLESCTKHIVVVAFGVLNRVLNLQYSDEFGISSRTL